MVRFLFFITAMEVIGMVVAIRAAVVIEEGVIGNLFKNKNLPFEMNNMLRVYIS